jgi:Dolichyl-phosphate-mannose-protein mannosyltransferase
VTQSSAASQAFGSAPARDGNLRGSPAQAPARSWPGRHRFALELLAIVLVLTFAFSLRINDLEGARSNFPDLFDEGIRVEQLLLMRHGFRPFREIYASQGPLLLDVLYPLYALFGGTLGAARLAVGMISLVGIAGCYWAARLIAGPIAGLIAAVLLVANPIYLEASRLALAEVPSIAPVVIAIGAATAFQLTGGRAWLVASAILLALGVLIKPMIVGAVIPVTAAVLLRRGVSWRDLAVYVGVGLVASAVIIVLLGPVDVYQQIVAYRVGDRANDRLDLIKNWDEVVIAPFKARPELTLLGWMGGFAALLLGRRGVAIPLFLLSTYLVMLSYTSLHPKHQVYLVPPLVMGGGVGIGAFLNSCRPGLARLVSLLGATVLTVLTVVVLFGAPAAIARGTTLIDDQVDPDLHVYDREVAATLRAAVGPNDFVLSDHPYLPYLADRMVPPEMVDPSKGRFRAGVLTSEIAIQSALDRNVATVLFWADRFRRLTGFGQWVDEHYQPVHILGPRVLKGRDGKDRSIYVRRDVDLAPLHDIVKADLPIQLDATFGRELRLNGARISASQASPGVGFAVTVLWEAADTVTSDFNMIVSMEDDDGQAWAAQQLDLDGVDRGPSWPLGRWLLRSAMLTPEEGTPGGTYRLTVELIHPRFGALPITFNSSASPDVTVLAGSRLVIGTITVPPRGL